MRPVVPATHARRDVIRHDGRERHLDAPLVPPGEAAIVGGVALRGAVRDDEQVKDGGGWIARVVARHLGGRIKGRMQELCEADRLELECDGGGYGLEKRESSFDETRLGRLAPASLRVLDAHRVLYRIIGRKSPLLSVLQYPARTRCAT